MTGALVTIGVLLWFVIVAWWAYRERMAADDQARTRRLYADATIAAHRDAEQLGVIEITSTDEAAVVHDRIVELAGLEEQWALPAFYRPRTVGPGLFDADREDPR